jgi:two-component system chemotaxis sensor kinase CheA
MDLDLHAVIELFLEESAENLAVMEEALIALETRPGDDELIGAVFRAAHTTKGNAVSLGFQGVTEVTHVLEDILDDLRQGRRRADGPLVSALLEGVDALRGMIPAAAAGEVGITAEQSILLERLRGIASRAAAVPGAAAREPTPPDRRPADIDRERTLRVDVAKLDRMLTLTGEIAISQGRLRQMLAQGGTAGGDALEAHLETERLCLDLQELVMKARMVPLGPVFRRCLRVVRDVAVAQGKPARLAVEGEEVEVDTTVVEHIRDPLTHLIRNALDHGIEAPEVRRRLGKDPVACITLRAYHSAGTVVIELADDGAGLDRERIAPRAQRRGLDPSALSDAEIQRLVFEPGFSTAESVTELSGRGIGLDVVRRSIESLRGSVAIESHEGLGTTILMRFPLTLAIVGGLVVRVADETFIIPLDGVVECVDLPLERGPEAAGQGVLSVRGRTLPYVRLQDLFRLGGDRPRREQVVIVRWGREQAGLAVDGVEGESQSVMKPLGRLFRGLDGIAGSTILGSGRVALILDLPTLLNGVCSRGRASATFAACSASA